MKLVQRFVHLFAKVGNNYDNKTLTIIIIIIMIPFNKA